MEEFELNFPTPEEQFEYEIKEMEKNLAKLHIKVHKFKKLISSGRYDLIPYLDITKITRNNMLERLISNRHPKEPLIIRGTRLSLIAEKEDLAEKRRSKSMNTKFF